MKKCSMCGEEKPLEMFVKLKKSKDGHAAHCKACKKLKDKAYYERTKENNRDKRKAYREANRDYIAAWKKEYYSDPENKYKKANRDRVYREQNKDSVSERKKKYYEENKNKIREYKTNYYHENKEYLLAYYREYYEENSQVYKDRAKNRRAKLKEAEGVFYKADVDKLYNLQKGLCVYCKSALLEDFHVDHIMPLSLGGSNWPENLQLLCPTCNLRKHAKDPFEWANEIGLLL